MAAPTRWFEVDRPRPWRTSAPASTRSASPTPATIDIGLDLLHDGDDLDAALDAAGHDADAPTLCIGETVFDTLTLQATASVCARAAGARRRRQRAGRHLHRGARGGRARPGLALATGLLRQMADEPRRSDLRPGDPEKLMVVTGWRVTHTESSAGRRLDPGAHMLILVCEPGPDAV